MTRIALKAFVDVDQLLTAVSDCESFDRKSFINMLQITIIQKKPSIQYWEQSINNVIMLKQFVKLTLSIHEALVTASSTLLVEIFRVSSMLQGNCAWAEVPYSFARPR